MNTSRAKELGQDVWISNESLIRDMAKDPGKRLTRLLIRYRGASEGNFSCYVRDALDLIEMLKASERYVRDVRIDEVNHG